MASSDDEKAEAEGARSRDTRARETVRQSHGERLAQNDVRSLADWLERLIAAEKARRAGKKVKRATLLGAHQSS